MTILFVVLLVFLALPLWLWLAVRIWHVSSDAARMSFIFIVPTYFWGFGLRNDRELNIYPLVLGNIAVAVILLLVGYKAFEVTADTVMFGSDYAQAKVRERQPRKPGSDMTNWCKDINDATYDPEVGTCVETGKTEALARSRSSDIFGRLTAYMEKRGMPGEFDQSQSAAALQVKITTPEIAEATAYYLFPLSMAQPSISVLLCVSEAACGRYVDNAKDRGIGNVVRNGNLLLVVAADSDKDPRINAFIAAFLQFKTA